jgi:hypothetical protein
MTVVVLLIIDIADAGFSSIINKQASRLQKKNIIGETNKEALVT